MMGLPTKLTSKAWMDRPATILLAILGLASFYLVTLAEGQNWSGDFSLYILHAQNLVEGRHYLDTGYLLNPVSQFVGPYGYPPVYSILLAPVYAVAGLDLEAMKWVAIACFCTALWLMTRIVEFRMSPRWALLLLMVVGLNPYLWEFTNLIRADFTFTMFCYLSLFLMLFFVSRDRQTPLTPLAETAAGMLIGVSMYLAYGTREIGIVLPLTLLTFDLMCRRRVSLLSLSALSVFALLAWLQSRWFSVSFIPDDIEKNLLNLIGPQSASVEMDHLRFVDINPEHILERVIGYRWSLQGFWPSSTNDLINLLNETLFNLFSVLAIAGYMRALVSKITVIEIFVAGYIAVLLLFGAPPTIRYLIPIFPFFLYYGFLFCHDVIVPRLPRLRFAIATTYILLIAVISVPAMTSTTHLRLERGVTHPDAVAMFEYIQTRTGKDDTIIFIKPRIMALLTGRSSATWPIRLYSAPESIHLFFDALKADYYVDMNLETWMLPLDNSKRPSPCFTSVYRNDHFAVYHYEKSLCGTSDLSTNEVTLGGQQ